MNFNLWSSRQTLTQALHFSGKNVRLSSLPSSKTFLKTTELSWTNTMLSRGGRRKLFNSGLMNKLIRIEWVSAMRLPTKLMDVTSSMSKNVPGVCVCVISGEIFAIARNGFQYYGRQVMLFQMIYLLVWNYKICILRICDVIKYDVTIWHFNFFFYSWIDQHTYPRQCA